MRRAGGWPDVRYRCPAISRIGGKIVVNLHHRDHLEQAVNTPSCLRFRPPRRFGRGNCLRAVSAPRHRDQMTVTRAVREVAEVTKQIDQTIFVIDHDLPY